MNWPRSGPIFEATALLDCSLHGLGGPTDIATTLFSYASSRVPEEVLGLGTL